MVLDTSVAEVEEDDILQQPPENNLAHKEREQPSFQTNVIRSFSNPNLELEVKIGILKAIGPLA